MNKIIDYLSQYFGNDNSARYPGVFKRTRLPETLDYAINSANHGVVFASRDEFDSVDITRL
jgi:hypothetical protein